MFEYFIKKINDILYYFLNSYITFKVKLIKYNSTLPFKADSGCAGYDVFSSEEILIEKGKRKLVPIGIAIEIPNYYYLRVAPRSGLSLRGIDIGAGVIDSSYRGEIMVLVINNSDEDFLVEEGYKIAQLIMERCANPEIEYFYFIDSDDSDDSDDLDDYEAGELSETTRGKNGFGSTGN